MSAALAARSDEGTPQALACGATVAAALGIGAYTLFPRVKVEVDIALLRARHSLMWCPGGTYLDTQREIQFVISLEKQRRLQDTALSHVDTGGNLAEALSTAQPGTPSDATPRRPKKQLILVGGGHAHAFTLKDFVKNPHPDIEVTLISRVRMTPYSGMLPGYIAGVYSFEECHIDLQRLCDAGGIRLILEEVTHIDAGNSTVRFGRGGAEREMGYDAISVDIGSTPRQAPAHVTAVKPIDSLNSRWKTILERAVAQTKKGIPFSVAVVGGGASGCEMALSMEARMERDIAAAGGDPRHLAMSVITRGSQVLPSHSASARGEMVAEMQRRGVNLVLGASVSKVTPSGVVRLSDGREVAASEVLWCTDAGTAEWLAGTGVALDKGGFIAVTTCMQSTSHPNLFAAGDCAGFADPLPKAGVFAVRQGPVLTANIRTFLKDAGEGGSKAQLEVFQPPTSFLALLGTGHPSKCIASRGVMSTSAPWLWELKDWIDRTWMKDYTL